MATASLDASAVRIATYYTGSWTGANVYTPSDSTAVAGIQYDLGGGDPWQRYFASGIRFGNLSESDLTSKYLSSMTITINNQIANAIRITALNSAITSTSDGYSAYNNFSGGTLIYTATGGPATITVTDSALIRKILLYGVGMSFTGGYVRESIPQTDFSLTYTYTDGVAPAVVSNLSPAAISILSTAARRFSWDVYQETGAAQTHFDLQYSYNDGATWTTLANKVATANHYRDVTANTFTAGVVTWRVRAWTVSGTVASDWVYAMIIVQTNPGSSGVTCDGKPRPTVSWSSSGQVAYQVRIGDRDSGAIFGTATSYQSPYFYADGIYPVTVRVQSSTGAWGAWSATIYAAIANSGTGSVALNAAQEGCAVRLTWSTGTTVTSYIVYRDGVPIAETTAKTYTDYYSNGDTVYLVRGVLSTGYYVDSLALTVPVRMPCDVLSPVEGVSWIYLRYSLSPLSRAYDKSVDISYKYYAGRTRPLAVTDGHTHRTFRASYASKKRAFVDALAALAGQTVILKDRNGDRIIGTMGAVGYDSESVFSADITITETDYIEDIYYAG